jgi:ABC-2 type transport system ATP-binding protein
MAAMVELNSASYKYPRFRLGPSSWGLAPGSRCALVGPNGAGKSTLLGLLGGQLAPSEGEVRVAGLNVATDAVEVRARVAIVAERLLCCPWMTVEEHFRLQAKFFDRWDMSTARSVASALNLSLDLELQTLSRGTSLKVALCAALAQRADLLLLDEPTAGLDPIARSDFLRLLRHELESRNELTVIFATHILEDLTELQATDLVVLREGNSEVLNRLDSAQRNDVARIARERLQIA